MQASVAPRFDLFGEPKTADLQVICKEMTEKAFHDYKISHKNPHELVDQALSDLRQSALSCFDEFKDDESQDFKTVFLKGIEEASQKIHEKCSKQPTIILQAGQGKVEQLPENDPSRKKLFANLQMVAQQLGMHGNILVQVTDKIKPEASISYQKTSRCSDINLYINKEWEPLFLKGHPIAQGLSYHELSHVLFGMLLKPYKMMGNHWKNLDKEKAILVLKKIKHSNELFADLYALNKSDNAGSALLEMVQVFFADKDGEDYPSGAVRYRNLCYFNALYKAQKQAQADKESAELNSLLATIAFHQEREKQSQSKNSKAAKSSKK